MKITADTNILVRVIVRDDDTEASTALRILENADAVALPLPCLCEFAWVLERTYGLSRTLVAASLRGIIRRGNVQTDVEAVETGLRVLDAGGDFADGVIAATGASMGSEVFVSFDRRAVSRLGAIGVPAKRAATFA